MGLDISCGLTIIVIDYHQRVNLIEPGLIMGGEGGGMAAALGEGQVRSSSDAGGAGWVVTTGPVFPSQVVQRAEITARSSPLPPDRDRCTLSGGGGVTSGGSLSPS
jgi:hypothetical protein